MARNPTVTVTAGPPGTRRINCAGRSFPIGEPVKDVPAKTLEALKAMPRVTVDVAGKPDADTPEPTDQE